MIANSQFAYASALRDQLPHGRRWLDLGCGHEFLPSWMEEPSRLPSPEGAWIVGVDRDRAAIRRHPHLRVRVIADIQRLPLRATLFDLVTANMVIEHLDAPQALFREVGRVLAPGGTFLVHTPNLDGYTTRLTRYIPQSLRPALARVLLNRKEEDVYPTHYRGNTPAALHELARVGQLEVVRLETVLSSPQLYRVPGVGRLEDRLLKMLSNDRWQHWRPCIIAQFAKPHAPHCSSVPAVERPLPHTSTAPRTESR